MATTTRSTEVLGADPFETAGGIEATWEIIARHCVELIDAGLVIETGWMEEHGPTLLTPLPVGPGVVYAPKRVERVVRALSRLQQIKGTWARRPLQLFDWQFVYEIAAPFGLIDRDSGFRVIRTLYVEKPRKNGKSTECSGLGLYLAFADGEEGAEVYAAAKDKTQAKIVFEPSRVMAERSPELRKKLGPRGITKGYLQNPTTTSIYRPLAADLGGNLHGLNVHGGIIDELHVHRTPDTVDAIETGTGSRSQPLIIIITTADDGRTGSVYDTKRSYVEKLCSGVIVDPSFYGVVFSATEEQLEGDPFSIEALRQANPGMGYTVTEEYLLGKAREARNSPEQLNRYLRLHLGKRTKNTIAWLTAEQWDRSAGMVTPEDFHGRAAYLGYDLSSTTDFTAAVWLAPVETDDERFPFRYLVWCLVWIPEARVAALEAMTQAPLSKWIREGWIRTTEGNVVDYQKFRADLSAETERLGCTVPEIAYDPWNATETAMELQNAGHTMIPTRQGYLSLNAATKEVTRLVIGSTPERPLLVHGGNPVLRWMATCAELMQDPAGNVKPVKPDTRKSANRIDGMAALVNAMTRAMLRTVPKKKRRAGGSA
jgi:phage terminase large subunit-like protein